MSRKMVTIDGNTAAEVRLPTDLWDKDGVSELNLMQLEGQARASTRVLASKLREMGRLQNWLAAGISATHHTAGRIDAAHVQVRRAICWNDHSLAAYHEKGLARLGGQESVKHHIGGPWASRYTLTHLLKDAHRLSEGDWKRCRTKSTRASCHIADPPRTRTVASARRGKPWTLNSAR